MESIKSYKKDIEKELLKEYRTNLKDSMFKSIVDELSLNDTLGSENNTLIMDSCLELKKCEKCKGLFECSNKVLGHYLYPKRDNNILDLVYIPCKYKKENDKLLSLKKTASKEFSEARFKNIDITDKKRVGIIKWLKNFYDNYDGIKDIKGLYLHGSFGSGKTYLVYALLNELKINKRVDYIALYIVDVLRDLKEDWNTFSEKIEKYSTIPILFIDDLGSETVSEWGRDEVLGPILQSRMNNHLPTFFTSNLTIEELEEHLSMTKTSIDKVKSRRIIERIKYLTNDFEIITESKR